MRPSTGIWLDTPRRELLQSFRAMQAVAEVATVAIPRAERRRWDYAAEWFDGSYRIGDGRRIELIVDHVTPRTTVGDIARTLLFPHRFFDLYRQAWGRRVERTVFVGMLNPSRRVIPEGVEVVESSRGRTWPVKAWDPEYVRLLGASSHVWCPLGGYEEAKWTYRFYEACAAGAIPVGWTEPGFISDTEWTPEAVQHNYRQARRLLTVPHDEIRLLVSEGA